MNTIVVFIAGVAVATAWRRRAAPHRQSDGGTLIAPAVLRNPDGDHASGRWIHGSVDLASDPPVFQARPDSATTRVVLDPGRFTLDNVRSGLTDIASIAPGMQVLRLRSASGAVEVALQPADASALASRFGAAGEA